MDLNLLFELHPTLYHMAHESALPGILKHGLLSTSALLDLFKISGERRVEIETKIRREIVILSDSEIGTAFLRDQKPIGNDERLASCLTGASAPNWHRILNSKVFFWVTRERVNTLRQARAYRKQRHLLLTLKTEDVVHKYRDKITLCHMNSGCCMPIAHPRSPEIFRSLESFDYDYWRKKGRARTATIVELAVGYKVDNIAEFLLGHEIL